jgi:hypothetical protein
LISSRAAPMPRMNVLLCFPLKPREERHEASISRAAASSAVFTISAARRMFSAGFKQRLSRAFAHA